MWTDAQIEAAAAAAAEKANGAGIYPERADGLGRLRTAPGRNVSRNAEFCEVM
jgi:hypothetical protein